MTSPSQLKINVRTLFLIDAAGALLSAFMLGIVLMNLEHIFGIPPSTLSLLAIIPCGFAIYDIICYFKAQEKSNLLLKGIAYANLAYCGLSISFAFYHTSSLSIFGWLYIIGEIFIVVLLSRLEIKTANGKYSH
ncbi:MAG: hypothetical protein AAFP82_07500 [Bacteroidota bacterium]